MKRISHLNKAGKKILSSGAAVFMLCACAVHAAEVIELRTAAQVSTAPKYIPHSHADGNAITGLCIDINRAIEQLDPTLRFVGDQNWQPTTRLEAEMSTGTLDVACGLSRNREREARFDYLEPPLFSVRYFLIVRAGDTVQVKNWEDVRALGEQGVVLMIHGFGPMARLKEMGGLRLDAGATDARTNLMKLLAGRARFYYHRSPGLLGEIRQAGVEGKVSVLPTVMDLQQFYMVVGKSVSPAVRTRLSRAIARLESGGELKRLVDKWYEE